MYYCPVIKLFPAQIYRLTVIRRKAFALEIKGGFAAFYEAYVKLRRRKKEVFVESVIAELCGDAAEIDFVLIS